MSRIYTVVLDGTLTAAGGTTDLFEFTPADDKPIALRGLILSQRSEVGDVAEEDIGINIDRLTATVTSGSGGTAPTPQPVDDSDAASGFSAEVNNTTKATTSGTTSVLDAFAWNERVTPTERWWPDSEFALKARQGSVIVIRTTSTIADDISILATAYIEEF